MSKIISKYLSLQDTHSSLTTEFMESETRLKRLRDKHKRSKEILSSLRGTGINTRGLYQEMDGTSNKLKDIEKHGLLMSERCNRVNVTVCSKQ